MASTTIESLKKSKRDFELQNFLVENDREKVQEGQKEHNLDSHDIVRISNY